MNQKRLPRWLLLPFVFAFLFALPACPDKSSKKKASESHEHKAGEKHEDHDHKDHDHKEGDKHEDDHGHEKKEKKSGG